MCHSFFNKIAARLVKNGLYRGGQREEKTKVVRVMSSDYLIMACEWRAIADCVAETNQLDTYRLNSQAPTDSMLEGDELWLVGEGPSQTLCGLDKPAGYVQTQFTSPHQLHAWSPASIKYWKMLRYVLMIPLGTKTWTFQHVR